MYLQPNYCLSFYTGLPYSVPTEEETYCADEVNQEAYIEQPELKDFGVQTVNDRNACDVCQRTFSSGEYLRVHIHSETGEELHLCNVCGPAFNNLGLPNEDPDDYAPGQKRPQICDICREEFSNWSNLVRHQRVHTRENPYVCDVCGKGFPTKASLVTHFRVHSGEKPFACKTCQRAFTTQGNLKRHTRTHEGEKPYVCEICQETFGWKGRLNEHFRTHMKDNRYVCHVCQKTFVIQRHLIQHLRIHKKEKPHG